jgi:hypothetical protein
MHVAGLTCMFPRPQRTLAQFCGHGDHQGIYPSEKQIQNTNHLSPQNAMNTNLK